MGTRMSHLVRVGLTPVVTTLLLLPQLVGCTGGQGVPQLSATDKVALNKTVQRANVLHEAISPAIANDPELTAYFGELGKRLVEGARKIDAQRSTLDSLRGVQFHLVNNPGLSAFGAGGPHVYVYSGLFLRCGSEEELAAAMAHALAHTTLRHLARKSIPESENGAVLAAEIINNAYTPGEESEADSGGFQAYARAGWDPYHFGDLYQRVGGRDYNLRAQDPRRWAEQLTSASQSWRRSPVADERTFVQLQQKAKGLAAPRRENAEGATVILTSLPDCFAPESPEQASARRQLIQFMPVAGGRTDRQTGTGFGRRMQPR